MRFIFDRDAMIKELSIAQEIITNKTALSILSNVLIIAENNKLIIKATDSTVKFTTTLPVEIIEEGRTTVFCDKFFGIISLFPAGDIEFIKEDIGVTIKSTTKRIEQHLKSQASDKFPEMGSSENIPFFEVPSKDFKEMIKQTIFSVGTDKTRFFLTGLYFAKEEDSLKMVGTDGKRLSCVSKNGVNIPDFQPSIVPTKIMNCVLKNAPDEGNINIAIIDKSIFIKFGTMEFCSVLIEGRFPDYKKVIPSDFTHSIMVNKDNLSQALKRTSVMITKDSYVIFKFNSGVLKIISLNDSMGDSYEEIPCRYDGEEINLELNCSSMEPLKVIDSENVVFNMNVNENNDVAKAVLLRSEPASDCLHIMMPIR